MKCDRCRTRDSILSYLSGTGVTWFFCRRCAGLTLEDVRRQLASLSKEIRNFDHLTVKMEPQTS